MRIDALDRLGVPVCCVNLWPDEGPGNGGTGYGATEEEAATGAYGELTETVNSWLALGRLPRVRASFEELVDERGAGAVLDPRLAPLPAGSPWTPGTPLTWAPMRREADGAEVLVPVELVASQRVDLRPGDPGPDSWLSNPITNGLGAGDTRERAVAHALLEILQRHGNGVAFRAMDRGVSLDLDGAVDPVARGLLDRFDAAGIDVQVKLADRSFGIPNLFVVGVDRPGREAGAPVMATACGEAAHPDRDRALRKALLEFASARSRKAFAHGPLDAVEAIAEPGYLDPYRALDIRNEERRALDAMLGWLRLGWSELRDLLADPVLRVSGTVPFSSLPSTSTGSPEDLCALLLERLAADGLDVLVAELTPPGHPVVAVKVLVPGLEVETMTYHRIGARNAERLLGWGSPLVGTGPPPSPGARPVRLRPEDEERLGGPVWLDVDAVDATVGPLYALYREPGRHVAPLVAAGTLER